MKITVEQPDKNQLQQLQVSSWPTLYKEVSKIEWVFTETEVSYFLEGKVIVETSDGSKVEVKKGDLATFPKGLSCTWYIIEPMRKHFNLKGD